MKKIIRKYMIWVMLITLVSPYIVSATEVETTNQREVHGFYAISSYEQFTKMYQDKTLDTFDVLHLGWANVKVNQGRVTLSKDTGDFKRPSGYKDVLKKLKKRDIKTSLQIFSYDNKNYDKILDDDKLVADIVKMSRDYHGVTLDFEGMYKEADAIKYVEFIGKLRKLLDADKMITVSVMSDAYAYRYKEIAVVADYMILMLHDYQQGNALVGPKGVFAPQAPYNRVKSDLHGIMEQIEPIAKKKVLLGFSFGVTQYIHNSYSIEKVYSPKIDAVVQRFEKEKNKDIDPESLFVWDDLAKSISMSYYIGKNQYSHIWFEDEESVKWKVKLTDEFQMGGISLWRLGLIPEVKSSTSEPLKLDVWKVIRDYKVN